LQIEKDLELQKISFENANSEMQKIEKQCKTASQELDLFEFETNEAMNSLRKIYENLKENDWINLTKQKNIEIIDICSKFIFITFNEGVGKDDIEKIWSKNYVKIKNGMKEFAPEILTEIQVSKLLGTWKNYNTLCKKYIQSPAILMCLEWIHSALEFKMKKDLFNQTKVRQNELLTQKQDLADILHNLKIEITDMENTIGNYKTDLAYSQLLPAFLFLI